MSMHLNAPVTVSALYHSTDRTSLAFAVARYAARRRQELELTVACAAELSGLELSEWYALEAGWVPEELHVIRSIAAALQVRWTDLDMLALFARCAQQSS